MCATLYGVDVIDIRVYILRVVIVIEQCYLDRHSVFLCLEADRVADDACAMTVNVTHELLQSFLGVEHLWLAEVSLLVRALVGKRDSDAGIEECELTHTTCHDIILILCRGEDRAVRPELLTRTALVGLAHHLHRIEGLTLLILLLIYLSVTEYLRHHVCRESVHTAHTHTVQTTRDLIRAFIKLTTGMEHGHHDLKC